MSHKSIRATIVAASLCGALLVPLGASAAAAQGNDDAKGSLEWGIRASFNNYTGGATVISDGATKTANGFSFELVEQSYSAAGNRTEAQFNGTVIYRKYCSIPEKPLEGTCQLDLTFNDPKVVISDEGSYLEATVSSKQYGKNETFVSETPVRVANLFTSSATFSSENGRVNWSNITTSLTEDGNKMFSGFYNVGEGLDPLSFNYQGEGSRPASDSGEPTLTDAIWDSKKEYTDGPHTLIDADPHIIVGETGGNIVLLDADLKELGRSSVRLTSDSTIAYDKANKTVYFVSAANRKELGAISVADGVLGEPTVAFTAPNDIVSVGVNNRGHVAAISLTSDKNTATLITNAGGSFAELPLPSSQELVGSALTGGSIWGDFNFGGDNIELLPMNDGTFVFNATGAPYLDGAAGSSKGLLISIDPAGATPEERAKYMPGSNTGDTKTYVRSLATDGTTIYRLGVQKYGSSTATQVLKYANRDVTQVTPLEQGPAALAAVAFAPDGTPILQNGMSGSLQYLTPDTFTVTKEVPLPNGKYTHKLENNTFIVRADAIYVPTLDATRGDYLDHYALRKLSVPVKADVISTLDEDRLAEIAARAKAVATEAERAEVEKAKAELAAASDADKAVAEAKLAVAEAKLAEAAAKFDRDAATEKSVTNPNDTAAQEAAAAAKAVYGKAQEQTKAAEAALAALLNPVTPADPAPNKPADPAPSAPAGPANPANPADPTVQSTPASPTKPGGPAVPVPDPSKDNGAAQKPGFAQQSIIKHSGAAGNAAAGTVNGADSKATQHNALAVTGGQPVWLLVMAALAGVVAGGLSFKRARRNS